MCYIYKVFSVVENNFLISNGYSYYYKVVIMIFK